jgi:insulin-like growth factor 2 receptor
MQPGLLGASAVARLRQLDLTHVSLQGEPRFIRETDSCEYIFDWPSSAACVVPPVTTGADCRVRDTLSGIVFDLQPLSLPNGSYYSVPSGDSSSMFHINVCSPVLDDQTSCGSDSLAQTAGACVSGNVFGQANSNLQLSDGVLSLTYLDGTPCGTQVTRTTTITFECDPTQQHGLVELLEQDACNAAFLFRTPYACHSIADPLQCIIEDNAGNVYDLSPLAKATGNWIAAVQDDEHAKYLYLLNPCRSLNADSLMSCPAESLGCQVTANSTKGLSLGTAARLSIQDGTIVYDVFGGTPCHQVCGVKMWLERSWADKCLYEQNTFNRSAQILFVCAPGSLGSPLFIDETGTASV